MFGYCWKRSDYPWISLWCCERPDGYMSRGIEFGTTGLHKPFPMLVEHPQIFDLPTFLSLDAQEAQTRGYAMFLAEVPQDFAGVGRLAWDAGLGRRRAHAARGRQLAGADEADGHGPDGSVEALTESSFASRARVHHFSPIPP